MQKHVFITKDGKYLKWDPSKKSKNADFREYALQISISFSRHEGKDVDAAVLLQST